jgi:hypothetical protein
MDGYHIEMYLREKTLSLFHGSVYMRYNFSFRGFIRLCMYTLLLHFFLYLQKKRRKKQRRHSGILNYLLHIHTHINEKKIFCIYIYEDQFHRRRC